MNRETAIVRKDVSSSRADRQEVIAAGDCTITAFDEDGVSLIVPKGAGYVRIDMSERLLQSFADRMAQHRDGRKSHHRQFVRDNFKLNVR